MTNLILLVAGAYAVLLFAVAFLADRHAQGAPRARWLNGPYVYTLSLSIYCTAWTFYGSVGFAASSGLEYLTIYLGPTLVMIGWWGILLRLVQIARRERITSIADLISSRYGKSRSLGALVTLFAAIGIAPYLALQLQSITLSFALFAEVQGTPWSAATRATAAFWIAAGLALFAILFGTRSPDASERQHGVVFAIALEGGVKLVALLAVGIFVVWGLAGGVGNVGALIAQSDISQFTQAPDRWLTLTFISATAFLCLPRMFHVLVVESPDDTQLATAAWAFPAYLLAMSLFTVPIAVVGLHVAPEANPDLFVLSLPLSEGHNGLALLAFLGGFSSATSMAIVATIALATMVSNHIVLPLWLRATEGGASVSGDVRYALVSSRRAAIVVILALGYAYYRLSTGGEALAAIGLISFAGLSQIAPALVLGLYWRHGSRAGAGAGLCTGLALWLWCLFLPSLGLPEAILTQGPFGLNWLRPHGLFGLSGLDPVVHGVFWSMSLNTGVYLLVSLWSGQSAVERSQLALFLRPETAPSAAQGPAFDTLTAGDLLAFSQRVMGPDAALSFFAEEADRQGQTPAEVTAELLDKLERELAGSLGSATAHAMLAQVTGGRGGMSSEDLLAVADEAAQVREYSRRLEDKSREQARTAEALQTANTRLMAQSRQKDAFLSQISHELRTPMTSISSFSDILAQGDLPSQDRARFAGIIRQEAGRLTRLLDDLLDLSVLERGDVRLNKQDARLGEVLDRALAAAMGLAHNIKIDRQGDEDQRTCTDVDRLEQVFINLISNAAKYCDAPQPELVITCHPGRVEMRDNGRGISLEDQEFIFERFSRIGGEAGGAGLGLAICREIMARLGGSIRYIPEGPGAGFEVILPPSR